MGKVCRILSLVHFECFNCIYLFNFNSFQIYSKVAVYLTNLENPRTQTEYEDSYTFKIFFFEFINFYSSLIYIAFFKVSTNLSTTRNLVELDQDDKIYDDKTKWRIIFQNHLILECNLFNFFF